MTSNPNQTPDDEESDSFEALNPPSGFIPSSQMSSLIEASSQQASKNTGSQKLGLSKGFVPSGKSAEEPPSGLIPSGQMSAMLVEAAQKKAAEGRGGAKIGMPEGFVSSGKSAEEPPSGLIPASKMSSLLMKAAQEKPGAGRPGGSGASPHKSGPLTIPPPPPKRNVATTGSLDRPPAPAKKGCMGMLLMAMLFLAALVSLSGW